MKVIIYLFYGLFYSFVSSLDYIMSNDKADDE
jgi:hypothetical protein